MSSQYLNSSVGNPSFAVLVDEIVVLGGERLAIQQ